MLRKFKSFPIGVRRLLVVFCIAAIVGVNWLVVPLLRIYRANLSEMKGTLSQWETGGSDERILVVAPHCDDETLGCAGILRDAIGKGAQVRVVVVTNGDGFYEVVRRIKRAKPESYIQFGYQRQDESVAAMRVLGLSGDSITFLGYPDRGVQGLWLKNWTPDEPFTSKYTRCSSSPYKNSFRREAPYCGRALLADLESIILSFRPTIVYSPHPSDHHSDHWATYCFVTQALSELNMQDSVRRGLYIVHRGDWPVPQGMHPTSKLAPPAFLDDIGMQWYQYPLSKADITMKLKATRAYRSQLMFLGEYLYSFARANELFAEYSTGIVPHIPGADGGGERAWEEASVCVHDPVGDSLRVDVGRSGDIRSVRCYSSEVNLYARIELARTHSHRMDYSVSFCGFPDATAERIKVVVSGKGRATHGARAVVSGNTVDIILPLSELGRWDAVMVSADTSFEGRTVDRTAWRLLTRQNGKARPLPNYRPVDHLDRRTPLSPARRPL